MNHCLFGPLNRGCACLASALFGTLGTECTRAFLLSHLTCTPSPLGSLLFSSRNSASVFQLPADDRSCPLSIAVARYGGVCLSPFSPKSRPFPLPVPVALPMYRTPQRWVTFPFFSPSIFFLPARWICQPSPLRSSEMHPPHTPVFAYLFYVLADDARCCPFWPPPLLRSSRRPRPFLQPLFNSFLFCLLPLSPPLSDFLASVASSSPSSSLTQTFF